jgi:ATP-dependent Clp protease ATP-binding subunit ClpB
MRFDKFTIKSQELIQNAQALASQHHNHQIVAAMLAETSGIAGAMLRKLGVSPGEIVQEVNAAVARLPGVSGAGTGEVYISHRSKAILEAGSKAILEAAFAQFFGYR